MPIAPDPLRDTILRHLRQLHSGEWEEAFRGLTAMDAKVVPCLIAAYEGEAGPTFRGQILRILGEFRSEVALLTFETGLRERQTDVWKFALRALMNLGSPAAIQLLESVLAEEGQRPNQDVEYTDWIMRALLHMRSSGKPSLAA